MRLFYEQTQMQLEVIEQADTLPTLDALYAQGMTYMAIAYQLGVSWQTVRRAILRIGTYKGMP